MYDCDFLSFFFIILATCSNLLLRLTRCFFSSLTLLKSNGLSLRWITAPGWVFLDLKHSIIYLFQTKKNSIFSKNYENRQQNGKYDSDLLKIIFQAMCVNWNLWLRNLLIIKEFEQTRPNRESKNVAHRGVGKISMCLENRFFFFWYFRPTQQWRKICKLVQSAVA